MAPNPLVFWKFLLFDLSNHSLVSPSVAPPVNPDEAVFFRREYREYGIERQRVQHMFRTLPATIAPNHQVNNPASLLLLARLLAGYRRSNL